MDPDEAVKWLLRGLNGWLRQVGFKRRGQTFGRESGDCWHVVNVQLSRFSPSDKKSLTVNFGVQSKSVMRFRKQEIYKAPLEYRCPIRFRVSWLTQTRDLWWEIRDESSARLALREITEVLGAKGVPFLDSLSTNKKILQFYDAGQVLGFEIDRDEARLLLLAESGASAELRERLDEYQAHWSLSPASERASKFLKEFKDVHGFVAEP